MFMWLSCRVFLTACTLADPGVWGHSPWPGRMPPPRHSYGWWYSRYLTLNLLIFWMLIWMRIMLVRLIALCNRIVHCYMLLAFATHFTGASLQKKCLGVLGHCAHMCRHPTLTADVPYGKVNIDETGCWVLWRPVSCKCMLLSTFKRFRPCNSMS